MGVRPYKKATCMCCHETFDRNNIPFIVISAAPRYIHASCAKDYMVKKKIQFLPDVIDPAKEYVCEYCHKAIPMTEKFVALTGDRYAHIDCKNKDDNREKTDVEKLYEYITRLYNIEFVDPGKQKSIQNMIAANGFTYSGIHGTLLYAYNIKHLKPKDSNYLGIVPYLYNEAKEYYERLKKIREENSTKDIENYKPKQIKVKAHERIRDTNRKKFSILDEENVDAE